MHRWPMAFASVFFKRKFGIMRLLKFYTFAVERILFGGLIGYLLPLLLAMCVCAERYEIRDWRVRRFLEVCLVRFFGKGKCVCVCVCAFWCVCLSLVSRAGSAILLLLLLYCT